MTIQGWFPLGWTGLVSLLTMGLSRALQHHSSKASILQRSAFFMVQLLHPYMTTGKTISSVQFSCSVVSSSLWPHGLQHARHPCPSPVPGACSNSCPSSPWCHPTISSSVVPFSYLWKNKSFDYMDFGGQSDVFVFTILSRFVKAFPPRSKCLLVLWLQSPSTVILEPKKIKSAPVSTFSPSICHEVMGLNAMILVFWMLSFKPVFSLSSFTFIKRLFSACLLSAIRVISSAIWGCWYFSQQPWFQLVIHLALHFAWCTLYIS